MPNRETERQIASEQNDEVHKSLIMDAYNFCADTIRHPDARARQAFVAEYGVIVGGIRDLPNEFINHPWETIGKVAVATGTGLAMGAALASESPVIASTAVAAGVITTAAALWNTCVRLANNQAFKSGMDAVYKSGDEHTIVKSMQIASDVLGPEAANYGIAFAGGLAGAYGPEAFSGLRWNYLANKLHPLVPAAYGTRNGAVEMSFMDGSQLHLHGDYAIYQSGGKEYQLQTNRHGIDLEILGSIAGRQIIKGWLTPEQLPYDGLAKPFKVDINPDKHISTIKTRMETTNIDHADLPKFQSGRFLSCYECEPENPNAPWYRQE